MRSGVKAIIFLGICGAVGYGGAKGFVAFWKFKHKRGFEHSEAPAVVTGSGEAPSERGFSVTIPGSSALSALADTWKNVNATSVGLEYAPGTDRASLVAAAKVAHDHHLAVVLLPPGAQAGTAWSAQNPYPYPLPDVGADAEAAGIEYVCISWLKSPPDPSYWREQTGAMRLNYGGKLILAADASTLQRITCPDVAEILGAIGPIEIPRRLPHDPADVGVADLRTAWNCVLTQLESFAEKSDKKLALLHMDVPATVSSRLPDPAVSTHIAPQKNKPLESMMYEALLLETKGRVKTTEVLLFDWGAGGAEGEALNQMPGMMNKLSANWASLPKPQTAASTEATAPE